MLKCSHCGRNYQVTHENIVRIDTVRMESVILCPHCKKHNTVKCAQAEIMTPDRAMKTAVDAIRNFHGAAIDLAVYGAIGGATALERVGLLSTEDGANWCAAARKAGDDRRAKVESKPTAKKKR